MMCGITGIWDTRHRHLDHLNVVQATGSIAHRGPDDEGFLFTDTMSGEILTHPPQDSYNWDLAFGFRRLSIIDLTPNGHQPMSSKDGRFWIVFNGEIYNYVELRQELKQYGSEFKTESDTEVILEAYQTWGEGCLDHFNGMWAFAIWDAQENSLFCSRDRFGIKPFYYIWKDEVFAFASEIKALLKLIPSLDKIPNDSIIYDYLSFNLLDHTSDTFFQGIQQIAPGQCIKLNQREFSVRQYWQLEPASKTLEKTGDDYTDEFLDLFTDSVRIHLRSDVAIGSCLSGGLDSSAIVAVANKLLFSDKILDPRLVGQQQKTFSACFDNPLFDERQYIEQVLKSTSAEANYTFPSAKRLEDELPLLIWHQDEPFGSISIFAQWCVMRAVQQRGVRVTLDGQGADEILAGYHGYFDYFWGSLLQQGAFSTLGAEWKAYQHRFGNSYPNMFARTVRPFVPPQLIRMARRYLRSGQLGSHVLGVHPDFAHRFQHRHMENLPKGLDPFTGDLYANLTRLSLPKLLHYEDRNSMAFSIESRVPFLDYRLVEYVFRLPAQQKIHRGVTKVVLRNAMKGILPEQVRTRKDKMGFVTPEKLWLSADLHSWVEEIITSKSFATRPYFDVPAIQSAISHHVSGQIDLTGLAWRWLNLEMWLQQCIEGTTL